MVVRRHALVLRRLNDHEVGEVRHQHGEQYREDDHGAGEPLAQGHASQHCVRSVGADGPGLAHFGIHAGALVSAAQQAADDDEAGDERRAALADEGQRDAGQRDEARDAADDDKRLQHDDGGEAHGGERADVGFRPGRRDNAADGEAQIQQQHTGRAEQARLLGDDREDEVALGDGDAALGYGLTAHAPADAGAEQVAVGDGIQALHQLEAAALGLGEGVLPNGDAGLHVAHHAVKGHGRNGRKPNGHHQVELLPRGHIQHDDEHGKQHQGEAEVFLQHDDDEGERPHDDEGQKGGEARQPQRPHLPREHREHLAVGGQVGGDEEHDENLRQLAGLEAEAAEAQPQLAAAGLVADDRQHGGKQQQNAHDHERVLVIGELVQVAHDGERGDHGRDADEQPQQLIHGQIGHNTGDEGDADARQRERDRQDGRVGRRGEQAHGDVGHEECGEDAEGHAQGVEGELLPAGDHHHGKKHDDDGRGDEQKHQLYVAPGHRLVPPEVPPAVLPLAPASGLPVPLPVVPEPAPAGG